MHMPHSTNQPERSLQEGELAVKIYPVATELIWLCLLRERGMTEEILHLIDEQRIHFCQLQDSFYVHKT